MQSIKQNSESEVQNSQVNTFENWICYICRKDVGFIDTDSKKNKVASVLCYKCTNKVQKEFNPI